MITTHSDQDNTISVVTTTHCHGLNELCKLYDKFNEEPVH